MSMLILCDLRSKDAQCNAEEDTLHVSAMVFGTVVLGDTVNENTHIVHRTGNRVKILTGVRFRNWLFTRCGGDEVEHKSLYGNVMPFH